MSPAASSMAYRICRHLCSLQRLMLKRMPWALFCNMRFGHQSSSIFQQVERSLQVVVVLEPSPSSPRIEGGELRNYMLNRDVAIYAVDDASLAQADQLIRNLRSQQLAIA